MLKPHIGKRLERGSRRRPLLEALESRRLLAADGAALADDSYLISQNAAEQSYAVLANDQFDSDYAGERKVYGFNGEVMGALETD